MAKARSQSQNQGERLIQFRHRDAQRVANAVAAHEARRRDRKPSSLPRAAGGGGGGGGGGIVTATFQANWFKGQQKIVSLGGAATNTAFAINTLVNIVGNGANVSRGCVLSGSGTTYILVNAECK
jgi:hypothetical protein